MLDLLNGFAYLFSDWQAVGFTFLGAFVGIIFGALPGLTASAAIAMLLPLSFHMGPLQALAFLYVIGKSGRYGGSIAAILFNTPGTTASAATMQQSGDNEEGVRRFINRVLGDNAYENLPPNVRAIMMENARELKGATMDTNLFPPFSCEDARNVSIPTLLLNGELSPNMFIQIQDILEQCLPNKERAMIPAASHGSVYENPQAFNEAVLTFLAKH